MEPEEFWSLGDCSIVVYLWAQAGRDIAAGLDLSGKDVLETGLRHIRNLKDDTCGVALSASCYVTTVPATHSDG